LHFFLMYFNQFPRTSNKETKDEKANTRQNNLRMCDKKDDICCLQLKIFPRHLQIYAALRGPRGRGTS
jgi:hypothetical protein